MVIKFVQSKRLIAEKLYRKIIKRLRNFMIEKRIVAENIDESFDAGIDIARELFLNDHLYYPTDNLWIWWKSFK
jgi:hypothetical protein